MRITDNDDINHGEAALIGRIIAVAALRGGVLTTRQERRIDSILTKAKKREDKKRAQK